MSKKLQKFLKILGIFIAIFYVGVCTLLYLKQDSLLFHPKPKSKIEVAEVLKNNPNFDTLSYRMKDGIKISAFISKDTTSNKLPLVIYFGGNAEEISHLMEKKPYFKNSIMALINYRGFGLGEGLPLRKNHV